MQRMNHIRHATIVLYYTTSVEERLSLVLPENDISLSSSKVLNQIRLFSEANLGRNEWTWRTTLVRWRHHLARSVSTGRETHCGNTHALIVVMNE